MSARTHSLTAVAICGTLALTGLAPALAQDTTTTYTNPVSSSFADTWAAPGQRRQGQDQGRGRAGPQRTAGPVPSARSRSVEHGEVSSRAVRWGVREVARPRVCGSGRPAYRHRREGQV